MFNTADLGKLFYICRYNIYPFLADQKKGFFLNFFLPIFNAIGRVLRKMFLISYFLCKLWIFCRLAEKCNRFQKAVAARASNRKLQKSYFEGNKKRIMSNFSHLKRVKIKVSSSRSSPSFLASNSQTRDLPHSYISMDLTRAKIPSALEAISEAALW